MYTTMSLVSPYSRSTVFFNQFSGTIDLVIFNSVSVVLSDPEISLEHGIPDLDLFATGHVDAYRSLIPPSKNVLPLIKAQFTSQFPPPIDIPVAGNDNMVPSCVSVWNLLRLQFTEFFCFVYRFRRRRIQAAVFLSGREIIIDYVSDGFAPAKSCHKI